MNVIRTQIHQLSTVLSEQNDFFNSAIQLQKRNERKKKAVLKMQFKTGTCKYKHSQSLILGKQDR